MTEKELNIVFNCLKDEEELEFETVGKMYNYIRKLEAEIKQLQKTAHNSDYAKCFKSLSKELYGNNPMRDYTREEVINIVRKHFA